MLETQTSMHSSGAVQSSCCFFFRIKMLGSCFYRGSKKDRFLAEAHKDIQKDFEVGHLLRTVNTLQGIVQKQMTELDWQSAMSKHGLFQYENWKKSKRVKAESPSAFREQEGSKELSQSDQPSFKPQESDNLHDLPSRTNILSSNQAQNMEEPNEHQNLRVQQVRASKYHQFPATM